MVIGRPQVTGHITVQTFKIHAAIVFTSYRHLYTGCARITIHNSFMSV